MEWNDSGTIVQSHGVSVEIGNSEDAATAVELKKDPKSLARKVSTLSNMEKTVAGTLVLESAVKIQPCLSTAPCG
jgi:hypothetical protein